MNYKTISNQTLSEKEVIELSPSFRDIKETISRNGLTPTSKIVVTGDFEENTLSLDKYVLDRVESFTNIDIQFIVRTTYNQEKRLFTSSNFKNRLVKSYSENNPYLTQTALSEIIEIDLGPIVERVRKLLNEEKKDGVKFSENVFVDLTYDDEGKQFVQINYEKLLEYIEWTVTKPSQNYDERLQPSSDLSEFEFIEPTVDDSDDPDDDNERTPRNEGGRTRRGGSGGSRSDGSIDTVNEQDRDPLSL